MIIDLRNHPSPPPLEADVCIVGGGAAGICIAQELAGSPLRVLLLEAGGLEFDPASQDVYRGVNAGLPYFALEEARLRFFGGTTNHWSGWCRPLDPIDFEGAPGSKEAAGRSRMQNSNPISPARPAMPSCPLRPSA